MFPDWWFYLYFAGLGLFEVVLVIYLWRCYRQSVRDCTKDHGSRWPNEPCGRALNQCPYDKMEHVDYFQAHKTGKDPEGFTQ